MDGSVFDPAAYLGDWTWMDELPVGEPIYGPHVWDDIGHTQLTQDLERWRAAIERLHAASNEIPLKA